MNKFLKKLIQTKKDYLDAKSEFEHKLSTMTTKDINKFLKKVTCPYSYNKDAHFKIKETKEENDNCTLDTVYCLECCNCDTKSQCYLSFFNGGKVIYLPHAIRELMEDLNSCN